MSHSARSCLLLSAAWLTACTTTVTSGEPLGGGSTKDTCWGASCLDATASDTVPPDIAAADVAALDIKLDSAPAETISSGGVEQYAFAPSMTNPKIDAFNEPHLAFFAKGSNIQHKLVVLLGAQGTKPSDYKAFCQDAALQGYHVLALSYPNDTAIADLCGDNDTCYDVVRQEYFDGVDRTDKVDISTANSINQRIIKALIWLNNYHTGQGWGDYVFGSTMVWKDIGLVGHSLGGGHAAMIARIYKVRRVGLIAAVIDTGAGGPAQWLSGSHETDLHAYIGLVHKQDPSYAKILAGWTSLGMGGSASLVDIDSTPPPYLNDQELTTSAAMGDPHAGVALDAATPKAGDGSPLLRAAWQHLVGKVAQ